MDEASKVNDKQPTRAAATVVGNNYDLLELILIRLPVKSLVRFKLVSKQWRAIISENREFAIEHSRRNSDSNAPRGIFVFDYEGTCKLTPMSVPLFGNPQGSVPSLSFLDQFNNSGLLDHRCIASCNGLLLATYFTSPDELISCVVCNPTTRDFKVLPPAFTRKESRRYEYSGLTLVFDPSKSLHYSVLVFITFYEKSRYVDPELLIYSSETGSWRSNLITHEFLTPGDEGVYLNDTVYWLGSDYFAHGILRPYMYYYNLNSEDFGSVDTLPRQLCLDGVLTQSCGKLYFALSPIGYDHNQHSPIFEFDNSSRKWLSNPHEIELDKISERYEHVVALAKGENETDFVVIHCTNKRLIVTDVVQHRKVEEYQLWENGIYCACEYIPSLALV